VEKTCELMMQLTLYVSRHKDKFCDGVGECRYRLHEGKFVHVSAVYIYIYIFIHSFIH